MNPAIYDQHLPELLAAANRIAGDLDRIAALPPADVTRYEIQHHDSNDDGSKRNYIAWIRHEDAWTVEDQTRVAAAADWLRTELPLFAAQVVGTDGIDDDEDYDCYLLFMPHWIKGILRTPFRLDADGQTSYWRPEDVERATYGDTAYDKTAAAYLAEAWQDFVTRANGGGLHYLLEGIATRLERPDTSRITDAAPTEAGQEVALKNLDAALLERSEANRSLSAADRTVGQRVRECIEADVPVVRLAQKLGVTRARIYQIRDDRR